VVSETPKPILPATLESAGSLEDDFFPDLAYTGDHFVHPTQTRTRTGSVFHGTGRESVRKVVAESPVNISQFNNSGFMGSTGSSDSAVKSRSPRSRKKTTGLALRDLDSSQVGQSFFKNRKKNTGSAADLLTSDADLFADYAMTEDPFAKAEIPVAKRPELRSVIKVDASVQNISVWR
jgi:hypothetical protein